MSVTPETQTFDFGRVMAQIAGLISRNFVPFFVLALLFSGLPSLIIFYVQRSMIGGVVPPSPTSSISLLLVAILLTLLPTFVLQGALTRASIDDLSGKSVSISAALGTGLQVLFPLLGLGIVVGLGVLVGFVLLIVPGVILAICWLVSAPALVVEKLGIVLAMQRSLALTRNHRWALFGLLLLYGVLVWIIAIVLFLTTAGTMGNFTPAALPAQPNMAIGLVTAVIQSFEALISTVGVAAIYFELRRIKEGVGVSELASVFD